MVTSVEVEGCCPLLWTSPSARCWVVCPRLTPVEAYLALVGVGKRAAPVREVVPLAGVLSGVVDPAYSELCAGPLQRELVDVLQVPHAS